MYFRPIVSYGGCIWAKTAGCENKLGKRKVLRKVGHFTTLTSEFRKEEQTTN